MNELNTDARLLKTAVSDSCDCLICEFNGKNIRKSDIFNELDRAFETQKRLNKMGWMPNQAHTPLQMLDQRRGYVFRNNFCPICGTKVNWKSIVSNYH